MNDDSFYLSRFPGRKVSLILLLFLVFNFRFAYSQKTSAPNDLVNPKRLNTVIITSASLYAASLVVLYYGWYEDNLHPSFQFVNDSKGWLQIDKIGHATTAYTFSNYSYWMLRWAGLNNNKAALYSGLMGFSAMTVIEILDGFSTDYGASSSDLMANALGAGISVGQNLIWREQRISLKFSYHPTEYAQYYPSQLGGSPLHSVLKDYNGHTYWLSANVSSFLKKESKFPRWINVAFGYGGDGMLTPGENPTVDPDGNPLPYFDRVRQYYFSLDIDFTKIKTNSKALNTVLKTISFIKIPFPTLEYNSSGEFVWYWIY